MANNKYIFYLKGDTLKAEGETPRSAFQRTGFGNAKWLTVEKYSENGIVMNMDGNPTENTIDHNTVAKELYNALHSCIKIVRQWHGEECWDIYFDLSPEMKPIREALKNASKIAL